MIDPKELLFSVDDDNNPIEPQQRTLSHQNGIWHRSCHIWIINSDKQVLCQQRSPLKDTNPGLWEPFFGGHLAPNQKYSEAAITEVSEELGINISHDGLLFFEEYKYLKGTEFQGIFAIKWDGPVSSLQLEEDEVQKVEFKSIDDIKQLIVKDKNENWTFIGYEKEILDWLEERF